MTVYQHFRRWSEAGIWDSITTTLAQAMADNSHRSLDSTTLLKSPWVCSESGRGQR
jgi:transposase